MHTAHQLSLCVSCRVLLQHIGELGYIADESVDALGLLVGESSVLVFDHAVPTLLAFQQMSEKGMLGAAIKAEGDHMIANLSMSDLRCVGNLAGLPDTVTGQVGSLDSCVSCSLAQKMSAVMHLELHFGTCVLPGTSTCDSKKL